MGIGHRLGALLVVVASANCGGPDEAVERIPEEPPVEPIEQVLERVTDEWMAVPGVVGTALGLCDGRPCIKVFATRPPEALEPPIPDAVAGHPVLIEQTSPFQARDTASDDS